MKIKRNLVATAVAGAIGLGVATSTVEAASLSSLVITAGTWAMGGVFTPVPITITDFSGANLIAGAIAPTYDTTILHSTAEASSPIAWDWNNNNNYFNSFTTAASAGDETGGVMSGTIVISTNFFFNHSDPDLSVAVNMDQGGAFTGTGDGSVFSINWTSVIQDGPFIGQIGTYNVSGTYTVVPLPAAAWLMGAGLIGLVGVACRRRKSAP